MTHKTTKRLKIKSSSNMTAAILLVLVLGVVISLLSNRHYLRWDLTATGEHTVTEKTVQVLQTVREPIHVKAFVREGFPEADEAKRLLSAYKYHCPKFSFDLIDPDRNPAVSRRYGVKSVNTFVLEGYGRSQTVKLAEEEALTNGLIRLTRDDKQMIYWLTGHGERRRTGSKPADLSTLQEKLSKENMAFKDLSLMKTDIPGDADVVIVAAPEKSLFPPEVDSLRRYLNGGGRVLLLLEPRRDGGLKTLLKEYGIRISDDIIVDKLSRVMGGDYLMPMVATYGSHEITRDFRLTSFFEMARSVEPDPEKPETVNVLTLASTSSDSWAETDLGGVDEGQASFDPEKDRLGPVSLAVVAELTPPAEKEKATAGRDETEKKPKAGSGKMVVFGDADFASNKFINVSGNGDFIFNTMNYLGGREDLITIQKKQRPVEPMMLTRGQGMALFWIPVVCVPLVVLTAGLFVWSRRRSR